MKYASSEKWGVTIGSYYILLPVGSLPCNVYLFSLNNCFNPQAASIKNTIESYEGLS